jgi:probable addiction module antidote protein
MSKGRVAPSVPAEPYLRKDLRDPEFAAAYLTLAAEEELPGDFLHALRKVVEAHGGIGSIAKKAKLNRQQLYKTLSREGNPEFLTLKAMLAATGFTLTVAPKERGKERKSRLQAVRNQKAGVRIDAKPAAARRRRLLEPGMARQT